MVVLEEEEQVQPSSIEIRIKQEAEALESMDLLSG
jgi:hypothetical protein